MTTTLPPTAAPTPPAPPPGPPPPQEPAPRPRRTTGLPRGHLLAAELALGLLTCAAVVGFGRIFADWSFLAPLLVVAVTTHVTVAACRRRGRGVGLTAVLAGLEWAVVVTWLFFVDTTVALVPTADTFRTARLELDRSWDSFHTIVAPAPVQTGFLLAAAAAVAGGAFLADWAAFRLWSTREALVPSATLFVFATLLADDRMRTQSAVLMVAAALAFVLLHRVVELERSDGWVTGGRVRAARSLVGAGAVLAVAAVLVGAVVAPHLPGVDEPPIVDWRNENGTDNARMLTSPLVDIRTRLVDTTSTPLFTVESDAPAYWRSAALDRFDGTQWRLRASTDQVASGLLETEGRTERGARVAQRFTIQGLQTYWLPAADRAVQFSSDGSLVRYDRETATLIAQDPTGDGSSYDVLSVVADRTPEQLRAADQDVPDALREATDLPEDFSPLAERLARDAVAGATTNYDRAMALQAFFRDTGGFTYSTDVPGGQSTSAIETFLNDRIGYCEQFAGTFAAMARSLGIPARVAVGYTWGEQDPADPSRYQVLGRNAHAWPEVWLGEYGWVPFEPTPGRGNPAAESYTGLVADQETEQAVVTTTTSTTAPDLSSTTTTAPVGQESAAATTTQGSDGAGGVLGDVARGLVLLLVVAAAYVAAVPGGLALRRRRRRARATAPSARVGLAWQESTAALTAAGVRPRADETHGEVAARAAEALPAAGPALARLAGTADRAVYGPAATATEGDDAAQAAAEVERAVDARLGRLGRLRRRLDPRPLWEGRTARHRTR